MPKIVDHDRRRDELADTALQIIARSGIRALTTRTVAEESGWSTGVLAHYFTSSKDLLLASLRRTAEIQGRILRHYRDQTGVSPLEALEAMVESLLPFDDRRLALSRVFLHFYAEGTSDERINEELAEYGENLRRVVRRAIAAAHAQGKVASDLDVDAAALDLVALVDGLSIHALLDPQVMKDLQQRPDLAHQLVGRVLKTDSA